MKRFLEPDNIEVAPEYLGDSNSVFCRDKDAFLNFYKQKYGEHKKFDLIISINKNANDLCQEYGEEIFPNTNILKIDIYDQKSLYSALGKQIEIIHNLHKDLEYLLIVSDSSNRGKDLKKSVKAYIDSVGTLQNEAVYIDFGKIVYSDIDSYKYYSQKKSVILLLSAYQDVTLKEKDYLEQVEFLNEEMNLPIYNVYEKDEYVEILGGCYLDVENLVEQLSGKIMLILNNVPIDQVDLNDLHIFELYIDKNMADKYNLNINQYKNKVTIEEKEDEEYFVKTATQLARWLLQSFFLILAIMVIFINNKKNKYKKEIQICKKVNLAIFNKSLQYILMVDTKSGIIIDCNHKVAQSDFRDNVVKNESKITDFFSSEINEILGQNDIDCYTKIYEIDFNTKKISFPTKLTSLNMLLGDRKISYIQFINNSENKQEMMKLNKRIDEAENMVHQSKNLIDSFVINIRDPLNVKRGFEQLLKKEELTNDQNRKI